MVQISIFTNILKLLHYNINIYCEYQLKANKLYNYKLNIDKPYHVVIQTLNLYNIVLNYQSKVLVFKLTAY